MPKTISLQKLNNLKFLQKLPYNVGDLGKLIVAKVLEKLPKVQLIAQSGHTASVTDDYLGQVRVAQVLVQHLVTSSHAAVSV